MHDYMLCLLQAALMTHTPSSLMAFCSHTLKMLTAIRA